MDNLDKELKGLDKSFKALEKQITKVRDAASTLKMKIGFGSSIEAVAETHKDAFDQGKNTAYRELIDMLTVAEFVDGDPGIISAARDFIKKHHSALDN